MNIEEIKQAIRNNGSYHIDHITDINKTPHIGQDELMALVADHDRLLAESTATRKAAVDAFLAAVKDTADLAGEHAIPCDVFGIMDEVYAEMFPTEKCND